MQKLEKQKTNIRELYNIQGITKNCVVINEKNISIFEIGEICLLEQDKNVEETIKNAYIACVRSISVDYQILIKTDKINMQDYIDDVSKKQCEILNDELKYASKKYIEYLRDIWKAKKIYMTKYYFLASELSEQDEKNIKLAFKEMEELGLKVIKIEDKEKIYNLFRECIN